MTSSRTTFSSRPAVGSLLAVATLLGGVTFARAEPKYRFEKTACPDMPAPIPELKTARCGQLTVPENRSKPTGRTIALSVAVIPAGSAKPKPDPIVWLAGGPGDDAITEIPMALAGKLNRDRDVVFMSQRGTYSAKPSLTCPEVDRVLGDTLAMAYGVPAMQETYTKATAECRQRLEGLGADLAAYNTIESSADLEDLRAALGIAQWNVFGISYGTLYALTYMRLYPAGIRSVGIDGVLPPPLAGGVSDWQSASEGLNAMFAACNIAPRCRERYGDIGATFRELVQKYEQSPETVKVSVPGFSEPVKVTISGFMLVQWAVSPGTHTAAEVPAAIDALAHGDATRVASTWARLRLNPASIGVLSNGLFYGVSCAEWVPYENEASVEVAGQRAFPTFPASIHKNAPNLLYMRPSCEIWNVPPVDRSIRDVTQSSIPTLVIASQYDAQTAPSFAPLVARMLPKSIVVQIPNVAHVAVGSPSPAANECAQAIVRDFFEVQDAVDTSCATRVPPTDFVITQP